MSFSLSKAAERRPGGGPRGLRRPALLVLVLFAFGADQASAAPAATARGVSVVAQATGSNVAVFRTPRAKRSFRVFANPTATGSPLVFLVRRRVSGWALVQLPTRPNGSVGWVRTRAVALSLDPFRLSVSLRRHRLTVWKAGRAIIHQPAAVGRSGLPTPTGAFYVAELLQQPDPGGPYGPYAFGLAAYSNVLFSFGGGAGQIGLHGTNEPGLLGSSVSHGCIRITNSLIRRLAQILPLGTPITITP